MNNRSSTPQASDGAKLVGHLLRELRRISGLNGTQLGIKSGMSQSKVSKLENGLYPQPRLSDIDQILNILDAPSDIRQKIYREIERAQPQALLWKPYGTTNGPSYYELDKSATTIRMFTLQNVPAFLQTADFRLALLRRFGANEGAIGEYMKDVIKRQDLLWDSERQFHFIMHEAMLYTMPPGGYKLMAPQLDRIERMMDLSNVKIGIVPLKAGLPLAEIGSFSLHDHKRLFIISAGGDFITEDADSISLHSRVFGELERLALYGAQAKILLRSVKWD